MIRHRANRLPCRILAVAIHFVACDADSPALDVVAQRLPGPTLLNEVVVDPPASDGPWEFVELVGPPANALQGFWLLVLEGDAESNPGWLDRIVDLGSPCDGGCRLGANGIALLTPPTGRGALDPRTTVIASLPASGLENGSLSVVLAECDAAPEPGDLDPNDAHTLLLPLGCSLVDAIAWTDGDAEDSTYGVQISTADPGAATRLDGDAPLEAAAWFSGSLVGETDSLRYADADCPTLTPGGPNSHCDSEVSPLSTQEGERPTESELSDAQVARTTLPEGTAILAGGQSNWDSSLVSAIEPDLGASGASPDRPSEARQVRPPSACSVAYVADHTPFDRRFPWYLALVALIPGSRRRSARAVGRPDSASVSWRPNRFYCVSGRHTSSLRRSAQTCSGEAYRYCSCRLSIPAMTPPRGVPSDSAR